MAPPWIWYKLPLRLKDRIRYCYYSPVTQFFFLELISVLWKKQTKKERLVNNVLFVIIVATKKYWVWWIYASLKKDSGPLHFVLFSANVCWDSLKHAQSYSNTFFCLDAHQSQEEMEMSKSIAFFRIHLAVWKKTYRQLVCTLLLKDNLFPLGIMHLWNKLHASKNPGDFGIHFACVTHRSARFLLVIPQKRNPYPQCIFSAGLLWVQHSCHRPFRKVPCIFHSKLAHYTSRVPLVLGHSYKRRHHCGRVTQSLDSGIRTLLKIMVVPWHVEGWESGAATLHGAGYSRGCERHPQAAVWRQRSLDRMRNGCSYGCSAGTQGTQRLWMLKSWETGWRGNPGTEG